MSWGVPKIFHVLIYETLLQAQVKNKTDIRNRDWIVKFMISSQFIDTGTLVKE